MIRQTGHAAGPGPVQAERFSEDYHGTHAKPARVLAHTCECRPVLLELCSRTTRTSGTPVPRRRDLHHAPPAPPPAGTLDGTAR
jgi:hypothetical protein